MHKLLHPQQLCLNHCLLWTFILLHDVKKKKKWLKKDLMSLKNPKNRRGQNFEWRIFWRMLLNLCAHLYIPDKMTSYLNAIYALRSSEIVLRI